MVIDVDLEQIDFIIDCAESKLKLKREAYNLWSDNSKFADSISQEERDIILTDINHSIKELEQLLGMCYVCKE